MNKKSSIFSHCNRIKNISDASVYETGNSFISSADPGESEEENELHSWSTEKSWGVWANFSEELCLIYGTNGFIKLNMIHFHLTGPEKSPISRYGCNIYHCFLFVLSTSLHTLKFEKILQTVFCCSFLKVWIFRLLVSADNYRLLFCFSCCYLHYLLSSLPVSTSLKIFREQIIQSLKEWVNRSTF